MSVSNLVSAVRGLILLLVCVLLEEPLLPGPEQERSSETDPQQ